MQPHQTKPRELVPAKNRLLKGEEHQFLLPLTDSSLPGPCTEALLSDAKDIYESLSWLKGSDGSEESSKRMYTEIVCELYGLWNDPDFFRSGKNDKISKGKKKPAKNTSHFQAKNTVPLSPEPEVEEIKVINEIHGSKPQKKICKISLEERKEFSINQKQRVNAPFEAEVLKDDVLFLESAMSRENIPRNMDFSSVQQDKDPVSEESSFFRISKVGELDCSAAKPTAERKKPKRFEDPIAQIEQPENDSSVFEKYAYKYDQSILKVNALFDIDPLTL